MVTKLDAGCLKRKKTESNSISQKLYNLLQAYQPCPPWSGNAILALQVFSDKTAFVLKG